MGMGTFSWYSVLNNFEFFYQLISFLALILTHGDGRCGDGNLFLVFCFQTIMNFFVDQMILFLTLSWKSGRGVIICLVVCFQT